MVASSSLCATLEETCIAQEQAGDMHEGSGLFVEQVAQLFAEMVLTSAHTPLSMPNKTSLDIGSRNMRALLLVWQPKYCVRALCMKLDVQGCELLHTRGCIWSRSHKNRRRGPRKGWKRSVFQSYLMQV